MARRISRGWELPFLRTDFDSFDLLSFSCFALWGYQYRTHRACSAFRRRTIIFLRSLRLPQALEKAANSKPMPNPTPILALNAQNAPESPDSLFTHNAWLWGRARFSRGPSDRREQHEPLVMCLLS